MLHWLQLRFQINFFRINGKGMLNFEQMSAELPIFICYQQIKIQSWKLNHKPIVMSRLWLKINHRQQLQGAFILFFLSLNYLTGKKSFNGFCGLALWLKLLH